MSKISVTTIAGLTSGGDANKVIIESGDTLQVDSNATVGGTLGVTGNTTMGGTAAITGNATANSINLGGRSLGSGGTPLGVNFSSASTNGMQINDTNSGNLGGFMGFYSGSGAGTLRANIQNANNAGMHLCLGTNGTVTFGNTGYVAANALDEYEEGTFTPSVGGNATYNSQIGKYVKIGRSVTIKLEIHINVLGTGSTSTITGIPFGGDTEVPLAMSKATSTSAAFGDITARIAGTTLYYMTRQGNVTNQGTNTAIHANNTLIQCGGSYITSS